MRIHPEISFQSNPTPWARSGPSRQRHGGRRRGPRRQGTWGRRPREERACLTCKAGNVANPKEGSSSSGSRARSRPTVWLDRTGSACSAAARNLRSLPFFPLPLLVFRWCVCSLLPPVDGRCGGYLLPPSLDRAPCRTRRQPFRLAMCTLLLLHYYHSCVKPLDILLRRS